MPDPQGLVSFTGIPQDAIVGARMTISHGISPSICSMSILAQASFRSQIGTLRWLFGNTFIDFRNCAISDSRLAFRGGAQLWDLTIRDRRWEWENKVISGRYNVRNKKNEVINDTKKTPRELATLCLDAMGEFGYTVSDMPNETFIAVDWSYSNAAQALANICDTLKCRVVYDYVNNRVAIRRTGRGIPLPSSNAINAEYSFSKNVRPEKITVVAQPTIYESKFLLEAVGLEIGGEILPINDLSYKPDAGWEDVDPLYMVDVKDFQGNAFETIDGFNMQTADFARESVYRWYRIRWIVDGDALDSFTPQGYKRQDSSLKDIKERDKIFLRDILVSKKTDDKGGPDTPRPAWVEGFFYTEEDIEYVDSSPGQRAKYTGSFTIDKVNRMVRFSDPVYRFDTRDGDSPSDPTKTVFVPARLYLITSFTVRQTEDDSWNRFFLTRTITPNSRTGNQHTNIQTLQRTVRTIYRDNDVLQVFDNMDTADARDPIIPEANHYLDQIQNDFNVSPSSDVSYPGIVPIVMDGARQQVSYQLGFGGPATTRASFNAEHDPYEPKYDRRRNREYARISDFEIKKMKDRGMFEILEISVEEFTR